MLLANLSVLTLNKGDFRSSARHHYEVIALGGAKLDLLQRSIEQKSGPQSTRSIRFSPLDRLLHPVWTTVQIASRVQKTGGKDPHLRP